MRVGFAGLGRMGEPMARNLAAAGHALTLWNRTPEKAERLAAELGCEAVSRPVDLTGSSDVVVTMLADDASSEAVHFAAHGLFAAPGAKVFLEMGTMSPDHVRRLVEGASGEARVIDAPVSGATQAAAAAQLMIMAGCAAEEAEPLWPVLEALGRRTICLGERGAGAAMKLAVNSMIHGLNQSLAEAMALAGAAGIAPDMAFDVIEASAAAAPMLTYRRPLYLHEADHEVTFTVALARKDMETAVDLASRLGVPMPQGAVALRMLKQAEQAGHGARDMAAMLSWMRKERG
ncbi:NAD(P)-dependent oxidoreductase [Stappia sp.]|uniref:NAD(P)-dependent oxidoreductase n=1 Tax=Stappia sp. TaxID=1870903 RepID=UPI003D14B9D0